MRLALDRVGDEIGTALLPLLNEFTTWLTSPQGQETLDLVIQGVTDILLELVNLTKWVVENKDWLLPMVVAIGGVTAAWNLATAAVNGFKAAAGIAAVVGAAGAGAVGALGIAGAGAAAGGFMQGQALSQANQLFPTGTTQSGNIDLFPGLGSPSPAPVITNNINVRSGATAKEIADAINKANKATGTNVIRR
jgi:hypothetical protein